MAGKVAAIGAGALALAAASYYFFGPEGKKNQKKVKGWMIKMKGEIIDKIEDAKELSETAYHKIVDVVGAKYLKGGKATVADVQAYVDALKKQWKGITKSSAPKKPARAGGKSPSKKAVKKAAKKK